MRGAWAAWKGSSSGRGRRTAPCRWSSLDQGAGLFVFNKCTIASPITWHRPVQFGVNPLNRPIALVTSNNAPIVPGAGAFAGFDSPAGSEEDRLFRLSWACPSVYFYATAVIKVFCLCDSADRRSAARPGSAATARHFFLPRLLHDTRDVRCSVCLSALHFAHQRARQQQGRQPRPRRRRGMATTRPPSPPRPPHPPHSSHPPRLPRSPPVVRRAFRTRVAARPCLRIMCSKNKKAIVLLAVVMVVGGGRSDAAPQDAGIPRSAYFLYTSH